MKKISRLFSGIFISMLTICLSGCISTNSLGTVELKYYDNEDVLIGHNPDLYYKNDLDFAGADPTVIYITEGEYEGYFLMYLAKSEAVNVYMSKDMEKWEVVSVCFTPPIGSWGYTDLWAPSCIYDKDEDKYFLFYSAVNKNQKDGYEETFYLGMAYSDSPVGPFQPFVGTNGNGTVMDEGTPIFDYELLGKEHPNYKKGSSYIDAFPFVDPQTGDKYLYMSRTRAVHATNIIAGIKMKDWRTPDYSTYQELTEVNKTTVGGTEYTERFEGAPGSSGNAINEAPNMIYYEGKYYLTFSVCATTDPEYSVMQAIGDTPLGPFTKVQESHGGVVVGTGMDENGAPAWDHVLCTGSHSFVYDGDELWIVYHQDKNRRSEGATGVGTHGTRGIAIDRVSFVKNDLGQNVLHCNGPTTSVQPKVTSSVEYKNIIDKATVSAKGADKDSASLLIDGLMKFRNTDQVSELEAKNDITIKIKFDDYVKVKSVLIYNSSDYYKAFQNVSTLDISFKKEIDGKMYTGIAQAQNVQYDLTTYSNKDASYASSTLYMRPGAPMIFEFEELEVNEITIKIECPKGNEKIALNEIVVLGKEN